MRNLTPLEMLINTTPEHRENLRRFLAGRPLHPSGAESESTSPVTPSGSGTASGSGPTEGEDQRKGDDR